ncbi:PLDc N-terminal domain-containing protein [Citrifermentans bremense]|uniref:PLDc N-terminal domain-containing protein n=1 Tax=Citrifermentans bremense TaxID=60035 RepID=UPI0009FD2571|nr:PLDc N-terminal domain-containing protein [Citrifermentans bremense]
MRSMIIFGMLVLAISVANAEVYKWEDANGVHFTDNPSSVPEKYRKKLMTGAIEEQKMESPQVSTGINQQDRLTVPQPYLQPVMQPTTQQSPAAIYQANLENQKRAIELIGQQKARALAVNTQNAERAVNSFVKFMAVWLLIGGTLFVAWISTIVDIVKSDFTVSTNKTVWMLLVIFLPLLGMLLYFMLGTNQKCSARGWGNSRGFKRGPDIY